MRVFLYRKKLSTYAQFGVIILHVSNDFSICRFIGEKQKRYEGKQWHRKRFILYIEKRIGDWLDNVRSTYIPKEIFSI